MGWHPLNLVVRFALEIAAVVAMGQWGWTRGEGIVRFVLALGIPIMAMALWGIFAVANEPMRGKAPVPVPGIVRLLLELALFAVAVGMLYDAGSTTLAAVLGIVVIVHYAVSYDRIAWLLKHYDV